MDEDDSWWYCVKHHEVEHGPGCAGKDRLGPKWTDEQRIDNCKVPIDKRGAKPRPSACTKF